MTWDAVPIGAVIRSSQYGLSLPPDPDGRMPIVGMKDIQNGRVQIDPTVCVNLNDDDARDYLLANGDILLNRTNSPDLVGKAGIYRGTGKAVAMSRSQLKVKPVAGIIMRPFSVEQERAASHG